MRQAQIATNQKNRVKSAILRMKASRIAQAAQTITTRKAAEADIARLTADLAPVLGLNEVEKSDWARNLALLLDKADQGAFPVEARLLDDLQRAWQDHEREIYTIDLVDYGLSFGKRPLRRALPSQKSVRITRHLASAVQRLDEVRLADADRVNLSRLLKRAYDSSTENLKGRFKPILQTALEDVGLKPRNPVEQAAFDKMVAELLDRVTTHGFISFGELRDTISRNQLKLPDLADPEDFFRGDPLLRLDGRLTSLLDGVYRPSEFYVRWLERGTSLLFGTLLGRCLTRFVLLPLLVAWMVLHLAGLVFQRAVPPGTSEAADAASLVLLGPSLHPTQEMGPHPWEPHWGWHAGLLGGTALLVLLVLENRAFRHRVLRGLVSGWKLLRWLAWDLPLRVFPLESLRRVLGSWLFQIVFWYVFTPGLVVALASWLRPDLFVGWWPFLLVYLVAAYLINSKWARAGGEAARDVFAQFGTLVRAGLLPGLVRLVAQVFKSTSEALEAAMYHIDEWLRFRDDETPFVVFVRAVLNVVWYPVSFLLRFFTVVLFEPMVNPLKLPLAFLAGKVLYPIYFAAGAQAALAGPLAAYLGSWPANFLVGWLLFLSPNVFGFLGWEMQENWRLYRANRARNLEPLGVGAHGETMRGLLQPGFHSGTVPLTYARLRVAEREASRTRNWNKVRGLPPRGGPPGRGAEALRRPRADGPGAAVARLAGREAGDGPRLPGYQPRPLRDPPSGAPGPRRADRDPAPPRLAGGRPARRGLAGRPGGRAARGLHRLPGGVLQAGRRGHGARAGPAHAAQPDGAAGVHLRRPAGPPRPALRGDDLLPARRLGLPAGLRPAARHGLRLEPAALGRLGAVLGGRPRRQGATAPAGRGGLAGGPARLGLAPRLAPRPQGGRPAPPSRAAVLETGLGKPARMTGGRRGNPSPPTSIIGFFA